MKVAFLIDRLETNSSRYRVIQYLPFLRDQGVDVSVHFHGRTWRDRFEFYNTLDQYDVLYVLRKLFFPAEFWYIRRRAKRIVYDFDDAVMYRSSGAKSSHSFSRRLRFAYMMKRMDHVIAGNEFLRSEALVYNDGVTVVPTSIDLSLYRLKESSHNEKPMIIGWLKTASTLKYLKKLMPTLEDLYKAYPRFQLKIVSDRFLEGVQMPVLKKRWSSEEEEADLRSFDIGLMPLTDDPWSRGKCGLKILQYSTVGVPVVCSPVGVNRDLVRDGVNGFWATHEGEWKEKLLCLIREEKLRREMGERGRRLVEEGYTVNVNAPRIYALLKKVCREGKGA